MLKLPEEMEQFLDSLEAVSVQSLGGYRSKLNKLWSYQKNNRVVELTPDGLYDFKKWLQINRFSKKTITSVMSLSVRYLCWKTGKNKSDYLNTRQLPVVCECGRLKFKEGNSWKCPMCSQSKKKKGRPSRAKPSFIKSNSALAVENEQCKTCQYRTDDSFISRNVNCNYLLITGRAKTKNKDYKLPPHCTYYKRGERIIPKDEREDEE